MVNGLGQNHLKWLQVRKFYKDHVYFVDLWITLNFIHSWGGLEFQLKVCVEERKEKIWWCARKKWGFYIMTAFSPTFPEKKSKYNIYFPESFRQWKKKKFSWLWKTICFNGHNCSKKSKFVFGQIRIQGYWIIRCR